ncbi:MAG: 4-hydroxy-tetrahydrodipicolinate reductase, partial [Bacteroidota bacterium]|nr:4-hydroxy-tetrahydrodipicolinate reductase [Candidatus Kapabacteria bacterium]MDW8219549.1 4-hydroxy-tetrahydrodipicolinate reductase [Bacteroidota bacterium]
HYNTVAEIVAAHRIGLVWGANFSVGVQMFYRLVRYAAEQASCFDDYDVALHELHHRHKHDAPSGTALHTAAIIQSVLSRKTALLTETTRGQIPPTVLHVSSTRVGDVPGTHTVYLDSASDTLEITHRARNRSGFAAGALRAARWIEGKIGIMEFSEIFDCLV